MGLLIVLAVAAVARLPALEKVPPGLHQDEAANAWNAYCLLKTGRDQFGVRWPVFCMRAIGDFRSTLYAYSLLPFQAAGGLSIRTTRLSAAIGGILTVAALFWVGGRLFGRGTGLAAAALLAINPTHIQMSRLGLEASQAPLLVLVALGALLWAGFPLDDADRRPRPLRAVIAGIIGGVCCYGYPAVRLFLPVFLICCVLVTWRAWWGLVRTRRGLGALVGLLVAVGATFGPLAYKHLFEGETIGKRGQTTWVWYPDDPLAVRVGRVVERYARHYHPEFLFTSADTDQSFWTVPLGFLPRYAAPFLIVGLITCIRRLRQSRAARVLLVGVALFPIADALNWHICLHNLRSSAGLWALLLLTACGIAQMARHVTARGLLAWPTAAWVALAGLVIPESYRFVQAYAVERPKQSEVYHHTHMDMLAACDWLRPRLNGIDAVICFAGGPHPRYTAYLATLVSLEHDPRRWFEEPLELDTSGLWDRCWRYGKFYFLHESERNELLRELRANGRQDRVVLLLRPQDAAPCEPAAELRQPDGSPAVVIYDCEL